MSAGRWRAKIERRFETNEKWLKDLQDFHANLEDSHRRLEDAMESLLNDLIVRGVLPEVEEGEDEP